MHMYVDGHLYDYCKQESDWLSINHCSIALSVSLIRNSEITKKSNKWNYIFQGNAYKLFMNDQKSI